MKKKILTVLLCMTFVTQSAYASVLGSVITSWTHKIANGTEFSKNEFMSDQSGVGKQTEYIAEYTPNTSVMPTVVTGETIWGTRTIKQAEQYMKNNGMTPLIGINASFFSFKTGVPMGHVISNGKILSKDTQTYQSIGFLPDGRAFISPLAIQTSMHFSKTNGENTQEYSVDIAHINKYNQTVTDVINLYTNDFDSNNHTDSASLNIILGDIDGNLGIGDTLTAVVEDKFSYTGSIKIPEGKFVLTLNEAGNSDLYEKLNALETGDKVEISSTASVNGDKWSAALSGLGSEGAVLVKNGEVQSGFEKGAAPRTAVGITESGNVLFYVIDGRQTGYSYGVQLKSLATRMKELGCVDAINLDGGGSTAISGIYPGSDENAVLNSPSEGKLRSCTNYIFLQNMQSSTGVLSEMYLYPFEQHYLSGYSEEIYPSAVDTAYYKMPNPDGIEFSVSGTESSIDKYSGMLTAKGNGAFKVNVTGGGVSGSADYHVYSTPTNINVYNGADNSEIKRLNLKKGDTVKLNLTAQYYYINLKTSDNCFNYEVTNNLGYVNENNELIITSNGGNGVLKVSAGDYIKEIPLSVEFNSVFNDISAHWAADMINSVYESGIISGYQTESGMMFKPDNNMTREEFAVIMCRFLGVNAGETGNTDFDDDANISDWAKPYVAVMADKKIISGKADGNKVNFAPKDTLTRAEAITVLGRVIGGDADGTPTFSDSSQIPQWAEKYIMIMTAGGFVNGYEDNTIRPNAHVTRAEAVTMLYKIMNKNF